jgi:molecular chaperone DnaJ
VAKKDYYEILGVAKTVSPDEMKSAYRKLALQYHPDRNPGNKEAEEHFKDVTEAYEVLSDPEKRAQYDRFGYEAVSGGAGAGAGPMGFDISDALRAFMREFGGRGGFGSLFDDEEMVRRERGVPDMQIKLKLTLEEIAIGVEKTIRLKKKVLCPACHGSGAEPGSKVTTCSQCNGQGQVRQIQRSFFGQIVNITTCPRCRGEGEIVASPCHQCGGEGRIDGNETVTVKIPAGVMEGNYMTLRGQGSVGFRGAGPGDLVVVIEEKAHSVFERHGNDILTKITITPSMAALGAKIEVPTLGGHALVDVPPGIQAGKVLRLRGKGIRGLQARGVGDELIRIEVKVPDKISGRERELYEELRRLEGDHAPKAEKGFFERVRDAFPG